MDKIKSLKNELQSNRFFNELPIAMTTTYHYFMVIKIIECYRYLYKLTHVGVA